MTAVLAVGEAGTTCVYVKVFVPYGAGPETQNETLRLAPSTSPTIALRVTCEFPMYP